MDQTVDSPPPQAMQSAADERATLEAMPSPIAPSTGTADARPAGSAEYFLKQGKSAQPILESVIGEDERARVLDTAALPWRMICNLNIVGSLGAGTGTGWLVGPNTILTAGHCVHDRRIGGWATQVTVTPGLNRDVHPFGQVVARRYSAMRKWVEEQSPDDDIAVIHLDADATPIGRQSAALGAELGTFGIAVKRDEELQGAFVHVAGYPGEAARGFGRELWGHRSTITSVTERRLFYDVDTSAGQSGGPAFIVEDDPARPIAIAIHAYGIGGTPASLGIIANSAPRITPALFAIIERWIDRGSG